MERLNEYRVFELVRELSFLPLEFKVLEELKPFQSPKSGEKFTIDFIADISWENKSYRFIVEVKSQATPKMLDSAVYQLKKYISAYEELDNSQTYYPLLITTYLNEESLTKLASERISGIDLSGNGLVIVPGELFVYRFGAKNKFPSNTPIKNVFRGVSSIVPRVFLSKSEYTSVNEVLDEITERSGKTTLGTVSKVLKTLEEELIISRKEGIRLIDAKGLLKNLLENYRRPVVEKRLIGKVPDLDDAILRMSENADKNDFLLAVNDPGRYAVMPSSNAPARIYTQNINKSLSEVYFDESERFSNLEIIETQEPAIYFDRRYELAPGYYFTSPLQVYLELANSGKREKETAGQIAEGLLNFRY